MSVGGTDHQTVRAGHDHSGQALVWGLAPWSGSHFSVALVPAGSALWICCLWNAMGSSLVWSETSHHVCWCWSLLGVLWCRPRSAAIYARLGDVWWELQSDLWLAATCAWLGHAWERLCCELRPAASSAGLGTLWWAPHVSWGQPPLFPGLWSLSWSYVPNTGCSLCQDWGHMMGGVTIQVETSCSLCWAWGHLARDREVYWGKQTSLFRFCGSLRNFGTFTVWAKAAHSCAKATGCGSDGWVGWHLRESPGLGSVSQVHREQGFGTCLHLQAWWEDCSTKEQWCLPALHPEIAALTLDPLALALNLVNLASPCMSQAFWGLLTLHWSP